jgi:phage regulator Rha-like protein
VPTVRVLLRAEKLAEEARAQVLSKAFDRLEDELLEQGLETERAEREVTDLRRQLAEITNRHRAAIQTFEEQRQQPYEGSPLETSIREYQLQKSLAH